MTPSSDVLILFRRPCLVFVFFLRFFEVLFGAALFFLLLVLFVSPVMLCAVAASCTFVTRVDCRMCWLCARGGRGLSPTISIFFRSSFDLRSFCFTGRLDVVRGSESDVLCTSMLLLSRDRRRPKSLDVSHYSACGGFSALLLAFFLNFALSYWIVFRCLCCCVQVARARLFVAAFRLDAFFASIWPPPQMTMKKLCKAVWLDGRVSLDTTILSLPRRFFCVRMYARIIVRMRFFSIDFVLVWVWPGESRRHTIPALFMSDVCLVRFVRTSNRTYRPFFCRFCAGICWRFLPAYQHPS